MRRRVMMSSESIPGKKDAVAGDILCAKENGSKMIFKAADYADINGSGWTPIGIVVIPPSHDVYGTGEGAVASLQNMDAQSPDTGWIWVATKSMYFGKIGTSESFASIKRYGGVNTYNSDGSVGVNSNTSSFSSYIFTNLYTSGVQCPSNDIEYSSYANSIAGCCVSPYLDDDSRNPDYYSILTENPYAQNACSDFDGKGNTDKYIQLSTYQSDWRTASQISNDANSVAQYNHFPICLCCWRYHTIGTNQGDWYLPAMGELGYFIARCGTFNDICDNLMNSGIHNFVGGIPIEREKVCSSTIARVSVNVADSVVGTDVRVCLNRSGGPDDYFAKAFLRF